MVRITSVMPKIVDSKLNQKIANYVDKYRQNMNAIDRLGNLAAETGQTNVNMYSSMYSPEMRKTRSVSPMKSGYAGNYSSITNLEFTGVRNKPAREPSTADVSQYRSRIEELEREVRKRDLQVVLDAHLRSKP